MEMFCAYFQVYKLNYGTFINYQLVEKCLCKLLRKECFKLIQILKELLYQVGQSSLSLSPEKIHWKYSKIYNIYEKVFSKGVSFLVWAYILNPWQSLMFEVEQPLSLSRYLDL